jgi:hypothetical protein
MKNKSKGIHDHWESTVKTLKGILYTDKDGKNKYETIG